MASSHYKARPGLKSADKGVRRVASTFGKTALITHGTKAAGLHAVEGHPERLVSNLLSLDPRVSGFRPQPMTVDVLDGRLLQSADDRRLARARHKERGTSPVFYTPDFSSEWVQRPSCVIEAKSDQFLGDSEYEEKLSAARTVLWSHGLDFMKVVLPGDEMHPLHVNVSLLYQASLRTDLRPTGAVGEQACELAHSGVSTLGGFCRGLGMDMRMAAVLIVFGFLSVAVTKHVLKGDTPAVPAHGALDHLCVIEEFVA